MGDYRDCWKFTSISLPLPSQIYKKKIECTPGATKLYKSVPKRWEAVRLDREQGTEESQKTRRPQWRLIRKGIWSCCMQPSWWSFDIEDRGTTGGPSIARYQTAKTSRDAWRSLRFRSIPQPTNKEVESNKCLISEICHKSYHILSREERYFSMLSQLLPY